MKDDIAVGTLILTIVAILLLVLVNREAVTPALEEVGHVWLAPWMAAGTINLEPAIATGHRRAPGQRSATVASAGSRRERGAPTQRRFHHQALTVYGNTDDHCSGRAAMRRHSVGYSPREEACAN
jgi:hypothetical protein